jgi:hypothetical protein
VKALLARLKQSTPPQLKLLARGAAGALGFTFTIEEIIRSIPEQWNDPRVRAHVDEMVAVRPACAETYPYRTTADLSPAFRREMHYAQRFVYRLRDVFVAASSGACYTRDYGFLESYGSLRRWLLSPPANKRYKTRLSFDRPVVCVHTTGFAHYLLEEVPRILWALRHFPDATLLLPASRPRFVDMINDELRASGLLRHPPLVADTEVVHCNSVIVTQAEAYSGFWHQNDLNILREAFRVQNRQSARGTRIYISRRNTSRAFANEAEVEEYLAEEGFQILTLDGMDFRAQRKMFEGAEVVVGGHGAGFANLVWCRPETRIIELFGPVFNDCFGRVATARGCPYEPVFTTALPDGRYAIDMTVLRGIMDAAKAELTGMNG